MLRTFGISAFLTVAAIIGAFFALGTSAAISVIVLIAIEISFSFDNAIINAKILERLSPFWQKLFLTVGIVFAIFFMRLVLPILIVMITADLSWSAVVNDALHHPEVYSEHLSEAHVSIASFGGSFLLLLTIYFFLDSERTVLWLKNVEKPLQKIGGTIWLPPLISAIILFVVAHFADHESSEVITAGLVGIGLYLLIKFIIDTLGRFAPKEQKIYSGWAAFFAFMYLQLLDASFSLDGVIGAFAITDKILLIALGLGVGAIWVRSLTVYLVRQKTLKNYIYLEHGAHYAIFSLSIALLASIFIELPEVITGFVGISIIVSSFLASREALNARRASRTLKG